MEFLRHTLPNGLEVIAEANDEAYSTAVGFFVQTGARDESDDVAGVSHFLEHMVFKGTPSRSASIARDWYHLGRVRSLEEIGALVDGLSRDAINAYLQKNPPGDFRVVTLGPKPLEVPVGVS